jgi:uncharacterized membrane protein
MPLEAEVTFLSTALGLFETVVAVPYNVAYCLVYDPFVPTITYCMLSNVVVFVLLLEPTLFVLLMPEAITMLEGCSLAIPPEEFPPPFIYYNTKELF